MKLSPSFKHHASQTRKQTEQPSNGFGMWYVDVHCRSMTDAFARCTHAELGCRAIDRVTLTMAKQAHTLTSISLVVVESSLE